MAAGGQRAGVAVGIDAGVVGQQGGAQFAQAQIGGLVVLVNALRFAGQAAAQGLAFQVGAEPLQALQGPEQIDRGRAAGGQGFQRWAQCFQGRAPAQAQEAARRALEMDPDDHAARLLLARAPEAYLGWTGQTFRARAGYLVFDWGQSEIVGPNDVMNPPDLRQGAAAIDADIKIPVPGAEVAATIAGRPVWLAAIISSVMFGAAHILPPQAISAALMALILCWLYWRTGSVWPAIAAHITNNALGIGLGLVWSP